MPHKPVASQHNTVASHQQVTSQSSNVTQQQQQHSNMTHSMTQGYHLPAKKPRLDQPPVLTLQEANDLKEQISQLHPGVNIIKLFSLSVTLRQNKLMCCCQLSPIVVCMTVENLIFHVFRHQCKKQHSCKVLIHF